MALEHAGKSIVEMLWDQLDVQYARLMELRDEYDYTDKDSVQEAFADGANSVEDSDAMAEEVTTYFELKGKVAGLAYAIAKLRNPAKPNLDAIRKEVAERYVPPTDDEENED